MSLHHGVPKSMLCMYNVCSIHTSLMFRVCIHLGVHNHHVLSGMCQEIFDIANWCEASKGMKIPNATNFAIVMVANK